MAREKFSSLSSIPELTPTGLLIPEHRLDLRVPKGFIQSSNTTTPIELGYILFSASGCFTQYRQRLQNHDELGETAEDFLDEYWMNHIGRAVVRAALDPDKYQAIDILEVYKNEEPFAHFPNPDDREFFEHFIETWGILESRDWDA